MTCLHNKDILAGGRTELFRFPTVVNNMFDFLVVQLLILDIALVTIFGVIVGGELVGREADIAAQLHDFLLSVFRVEDEFDVDWLLRPADGTGPYGLLDFLATVQLLVLLKALLDTKVFELALITDWSQEAIAT